MVEVVVRRSSLLFEPEARSLHVRELSPPETKLETLGLTISCGPSHFLGELTGAKGYQSLGKLNTLTEVSERTGSEISWRARPFQTESLLSSYSKAQDPKL